MLPTAARSSGAAKLGQQLRRIAGKWPEDPFRPNIQLRTFLESLADHPNLTPQAVEAAHALKNNEIMKKVSRIRGFAIVPCAQRCGWFVPSILFLQSCSSPHQCRITTVDLRKALRKAPKALAVRGGRFSLAYGREIGQSGQATTVPVYLK